MKNRTISVNHQLIYKNFGDGCKFHVSEPKTDAGKRTILMTETVHRAFVELYQFLISRESQPMIGWRFSMCKKQKICKWYVNQIKYKSMNSQKPHKTATSQNFHTILALINSEC